MLKGEQFAEVRDAIVEAFNADDFDMLLHERLDYGRAQHVADDGFKVVVSQVLIDLGKKGLERKLIAAVAEARPEKKEIQTICRKYAAGFTEEGDSQTSDPRSVTEGEASQARQPRPWARIIMVVVALVVAGGAYVLIEGRDRPDIPPADPPPVLPGPAIARFVTKLVHQPQAGVRVVLKSSDGEWQQETTSDGGGLATFSIPTARLQEELWLTLPDHEPRFSPESYRYIESSSSVPINVPPPPPSP